MWRLIQAPANGRVPNNLARFGNPNSGGLALQALSCYAYSINKFKAMGDLFGSVFGILLAGLFLTVGLAVLIKLLSSGGGVLVFGALILFFSLAAAA